MRAAQSATSGCSTSHRSPPRSPTRAARASACNSSSWARSSPLSISAARTSGSSIGLSRHSVGRVCRGRSDAGGSRSRRTRSPPARHRRGVRACRRCRSPEACRSRAVRGRRPRTVDSTRSTFSTTSTSTTGRGVGAVSSSEAAPDLGNAAVDRHLPEESSVADLLARSAERFGAVLDDHRSEPQGRIHENIDDAAHVVGGLLRCAGTGHGSVRPGTARRRLNSSVGSSPRTMRKHCGHIFSSCCLGWIPSTAAPRSSTTSSSSSSSSLATRRSFRILSRSSSTSSSSTRSSSSSSSSALALLALGPRSAVGVVVVVATL